MSTKIRHLALYTENHDRMATFYQKVFGMKRITRSFNDPNRGHISDGVIGLAVLNRRPGFAAALDHFGFEVDDVGSILEKMQQKYPKTLVTKGLEQVAFAVFRSHDPAGAQFDISWKEHPKVQEVTRNTAGSNQGKSTTSPSELWSPSRSPNFIMRFLNSRKAKIFVMKIPSA